MEDYREKELHETVEIEETVESIDDELVRRTVVHTTTETKSDGIAFMAISWVAFALSFIPFLPFKLAIIAIGVVMGYLYRKMYNGSSAPFIANIVMLVVRLVIMLMFSAALFSLT